MYPLFIYYQDTNQITLSGESDTVIMGCRYAPGTGKISQAQPGEVIEEVIDVSLEGTWENIRAKIFSIEKYLEMANQETIPRDWVYLRFYDHDAPFDWRSRIVGGRVEFLNHGLVDRDGESQLVKVYVTRLNYWAGSKRSLPCFAAGDASPLIGQYVENIFGHSDAGHKNYFGIDGHLAENDLPTPIEIDFMNALTGDLFYNLTISERVIRGTTRLEAGFLEGEALAAGSGATRTIVADADCSAGNYAHFDWNSAAEVQIATYAFSAAELAILRGQVQRGIMRLQAVMAYTDLWLCLRVLAPTTGAVLAESLWMLAPAGTKYLELPPIAIPPGLAGYLEYQTVTVAIYGRKSGGGAVAVPIDFIDFVPAESIRRLTAVNPNQTMGVNYLLIDSGSEEITYYRNADSSKAVSHIGTGNFPVIYPGYDSIIQVNHRGGGDSSYLIGIALVAIPYYEPRRRNL